MTDFSIPGSRGLSRREALVLGAFAVGAVAVGDSFFAVGASAEPVWWHPFRRPAWVGDGFYETGPHWHPYPGQHKAQDLDGGDEGEPIYAVGNGTVQQAGPSSINGLGNTVQVDHGGGVVSLYAHLSAVSVVNGQTVVGGHTSIGAMGATGDAWGAHLHLEIWTSSSRDSRIDPGPRVGSLYAPLALSGSPIIPTYLETKVAIAIAQTVRAGVGLHYMFASPTRVTLSPELSMMSAADRAFQDSIMRATAMASGYPANYVPPVIDDSPNGGWFLRNQIANLISGMPTNFALAPGNPYQA